ncbi:hypothetical protein PF008_g30679 [Phytophthora fragariae]|uniref:Uncharacterized protein n=1 Tax=Phytophthora fragariae TaxID=53985 RepID=A0A6G0Q5N2_9STRA|nr:hypothetical protein PF008_g30679 [Phytophthora fragariae]
MPSVPWYFSSVVVVLALLFQLPFEVNTLDRSWLNWLGYVRGSQIRWYSFRG